METTSNDTHAATAGPSQDSITYCHRAVRLQKTEVMQGLLLQKVMGCYCTSPLLHKAQGNLWTPLWRDALAQTGS